MGSLERCIRKLSAVSTQRSCTSHVVRYARDNVEPTSKEDSIVAFEAQTSFGTFQLTVFNPLLQEKHRSTLVHALYLDAIEEHIQFIEHWLRTPVYLKPLSEGYPCEPCLLRLSRPSVDRLVVSLRLPARTWVLVQDFPDSCVHEPWKIEWMAFSCRMILGRVTLTNVDVRQIAPGMVVLLPESFLNPWKVHVQLPRLGLMYAGQLDSRSRCWSRAFDSTGRGNSLVSKSEPEHDLASVCITVPVKGDRLTGMRTVADVYMGEDLSRFACYMNLTGGLRALGFLVQVAGGYGFHVKTCGFSIRPPGG